MPNLTLPSHIIYDWDNTLATNWNVVTDSFNAMRTHFGEEHWTSEELKQRSQHSTAENFSKWYGPKADEAIKVFRSEFGKRHLEALTVLPAAKQLLDFIAGQGIPQFIISNKNSEFLHKEVQQLNWGGYFTKIIGAGDCARDKPHPMVVEAVLAGSNLNPTQGWFIGDAEVDVECGASAGMTTILLRDAQTLQARPAPAATNHVFADLTQLLTALGIQLD